MNKYVLKRVIHSFIVIWVVATIVFLSVRAIPGNPVELMLGGDAPSSAIETFRQEYGLNQPIYVQYVKWLGNIIIGDFGTSIFFGQPVGNVLAGAAEPTLSIALVAMVLAVIIGIPAGIISAVRQYSIPDYVATFFSFLGISVPGFWMGILLVLLVGSMGGFLPTFGYTSISEVVVPWLSQIILPAIATGTPLIGYLMRMTRSSMLEVLNEDYMRTAHAKGLNGRLVLLKHGLQNALIPVVTLSGIMFAVLLGGVVAVELVFGIQGFGRVLIGSIERRDFAVVQAAVIIVAFIFVFMNLIVDLLYTLINPQIKYGGE